MTTDIDTDIRGILRDYARLSMDASDIGETDDLYAAGMTSHASVTVMLACEDAWDVEFPQHLLKKSTFASISAIRAALAEIGVAS